MYVYMYVAHVYVYSGSRKVAASTTKNELPNAANSHTHTHASIDINKNLLRSNDSVQPAISKENELPTSYKHSG